MRRIMNGSAKKFEKNNEQLKITKRACEAWRKRYMSITDDLN